MRTPPDQIRETAPHSEGSVNGDGPGLPLPARHGDPLAVLLGMLSKREPSASIIQMQRNLARDLFQDQTPTWDGILDVSESQPVPPVSVLSVRRGSGPDTFRLEIEISLSVAEWLGRVGSAFWPVFGAVEEKRKRERVRNERRARYDERFARYKQAGRVGYHRTRKASSPDHHEQILAELMDRYLLEREAVEQAIREHRKAFRSAVSQRRRRAILRLNAVGLSQPEIADCCRISIGLVQHVLRGPGKK